MNTATDVDGNTQRQDGRTALSLLQSLQQDVAALKSGHATDTQIRTEDK